MQISRSNGCCSKKTHPHRCCYWTKWTDEGKTVIAPALFAYEVTNILYRQSVTGKLTYDESRRGLEKLFSLEIQLKFSLYEEVSAVQTPLLAHLPLHTGRI